jgi:hypothetical protein
MRSDFALMNFRSGSQASFLSLVLWQAEHTAEKGEARFFCCHSLPATLAVAQWGETPSLASMTGCLLLISSSPICGRESQAAI